MINLLHDGTPAQKAKYLVPVARGEIRSCFAMTEPEPGAGSDPGHAAHRRPSAAATAG